MAFSYPLPSDIEKVLNTMVRNNPGLISGSFSILVHNPTVLEFDNKRNYFSQKLHKARSREQYGNLQLNVRRPHVFEDQDKPLFSAANALDLPQNPAADRCFGKWVSNWNQGHFLSFALAHLCSLVWLSLHPLPSLLSPILVSHPAQSWAWSETQLSISVTSCR